MATESQLKNVKQKPNTLPQDFEANGNQSQVSSSNKKQILPSISRTLTPAPIEPLNNVVCFFCGGRNTCKKEIAEYNKLPNAIVGLHSNWITENILAMQRPSTKIIQEHGLIQQFKKHYIGAVINLQQSGEHAKCGPELIPNVGFTYKPEEFQSNHIHFFNLGWEDMTADTTFQNLLRICSAFEMAFKDGQKVAVHCHAGTGRTGVGICAWLIYGERMSAIDAIKLFQLKRADSLSKSAQQNLLKDFEETLQQKRRWFDYPLKAPDSLEDIVRTQNLMITGHIRKQTKSLPAPLYITIVKFLQLLDFGFITNTQIFQAFVTPHLLQNSTPIDEKELWKLKDAFNQHNYKLGQVQDYRLLALLFMECLAVKQVVLDYQVDLLSRSGSLENQELLNELGQVRLDILRAICRFAALSELKTPTNLMKRFLERISIELLGKRNVLDHLFFGYSILSNISIPMPQVHQLSAFLMQNTERLKAQLTQQLSKDQAQPLEGFFKSL